MSRKRQISVRFNDDEWEAVTAAAEAEKRSLSNWILMAVVRELEILRQIDEGEA